MKFRNLSKFEFVKGNELTNKILKYILLFSLFQIIVFLSLNTINSVSKSIVNNRLYLSILFSCLIVFNVGFIIAILLISRKNRSDKKPKPNNPLHYYLSKNENILNHLLEKSPVGITITNEEGNFEFINLSFSKYCGYSQEEIIGKNLGTFFSDENRIFVMEGYKRGFIHKEDRTREYEYIVKDGKKINVIISSIYVLDNSDKPKRVSFIIDITDRKRFEKELTQAKEEAEKASRIKTDFLSTMSHEIRTPMNAILNFMEMLSLTNLDNRQKEYVSVATKSAETLLGILDSILEFSQLDSGKIKINRSDFNLKNLLENICKVYSLQANNKKLNLLLFFDNVEVPENVIADSSKISQVLINLIGNAIKFTEKGQIDIKIDKIKENNKEYIRFCVSDTGIGIPDDKINNLFKVFTQLDHSTTRRYGGIGIGLAISKTLVELMGGKIIVESRENSGSNFYFTIPLIESQSVSKKQPAPKIHEEIGEIEKEIKILLAEDNYSNQKIVEIYIKNKGWNIEIASNGKEVIEKIKHSQFDIILMDLMMPEMDGFKATEIIRKNEKHTGKHIKIIALTANAFEEDREKCFAVGMDDYVSKPISSAELYEIIEKNTKDQTEQIILTKIKDEEQKNNVFNNTMIDMTEMKIINPKSQKEILKIYLNDLKKQMELLKTAIDKTDFNQVNFVAHRIKGGVLNFKATKVAETAFKIEKMGKIKNLDNCLEAYSDLEKEIVYLNFELEEYLKTL